MSHLILLTYDICNIIPKFFEMVEIYANFFLSFYLSKLSNDGSSSQWLTICTNFPERGASWGDIYVNVLVLQSF